VKEKMQFTEKKTIFFDDENNTADETQCLRFNDNINYNSLMNIYSETMKQKK
jgi:hypothetical protein